jgi:hypothetical protein
MSRYVGIWDGGDGYAFPSWRDHAEMFESIAHAESVLRARYHGGEARNIAPRRVEWVEMRDGEMGPVASRPGEALATPDVEPGSFVVLAVDDGTCPLRALETDGAVDLTLEIGPRGGVRRIRH